MARKPRLHFPGACYHVILRGNQGQAVFSNDKDRNRFFFLIKEGIDRYQHRVHAFCLMTNHIHLALQVGDVPLSRIMHNLSFRYTQYINKKKKNGGHLFQGRYKAIVIEMDSYLLELIRYIHLNPVRAGMINILDEYPWSSHQAYLGMKEIGWLTTDWLLSRYSKQITKARKEYVEFVNRGLAGGQRKEFHIGNHEGRILGNDDFVQKVLDKMKEQTGKPYTLEEVISVICQQHSIEPDDLARGGRQRKFSEPRAMVALLVRESSHLSLTELGQKFNRDLSGLSQAANRLERRMNIDQDLSIRFRHFEELIQ